MTFGSNVQPRRRVMPKPKAWICLGPEPYGPDRSHARDPVLVPAHLNQCPVCGAKRPCSTT